MEHCVKDREPVTTRTAYANGYLATLQVTSYNFPETDNTENVVLVFLRLVPCMKNNAAQHLADLEMLSIKEVLKPAVFF